MTLEAWATLATIAFGAVTAWSVIVSLLKGRKRQLREDYKFARDFTADLKGIARDHPLLQQIGCHALTGHASIELPAFEYLEQLDNPEKAIEDYAFGRKYLEFAVTTQSEPIHFKRFVAHKGTRIAIKLFFLTLYLISYALAWSPALLYTFKLLGPEKPRIALLVTACIFFPMAYFALRAAVRLKRAETLVRTLSPRSNLSSKRIRKELRTA